MQIGIPGTFLVVSRHQAKYKRSCGFWMILLPQKRLADHLGKISELALHTSYSPNKESVAPIPWGLMGAGGSQPCCWAGAFLSCTVCIALLQSWVIKAVDVFELAPQHGDKALGFSCILACFVLDPLPGRQMVKQADFAHSFARAAGSVCCVYSTPEIRNSIKQASLPGPVTIALLQSSKGGARKSRIGIITS